MCCLWVHVCVRLSVSQDRAVKTNGVYHVEPGDKFKKPEPNSLIPLPLSLWEALCVCVWGGVRVHVCAYLCGGQLEVSFLSPRVPSTLVLCACVSGACLGTNTPGRGG